MRLPARDLFDYGFFSGVSELILFPSSSNRDFGSSRKVNFLSLLGPIMLYYYYLEYYAFVPLLLVIPLGLNS
jgi:hypothetical protein